MTSPKILQQKDDSAGYQNGPLKSSSFAVMVDSYLNKDHDAPAMAEGHHAATALGARLKSYPRPQEELDLHGLNAEDAEKAVRHFVESCRKIRLATLRIITGKGLHSPGPPVLPSVAEATVINLQREKLILAYHWEKKRQGGKKRQGRSGALIVYLP